MTTIHLLRTADGWFARCSDYVELFGTDTIPTAFTGLAAPATVLREITARNPSARVVLG